MVVHQFVPKRDLQLAVGIREQERVSFPPEVGPVRQFFLSAAAFWFRHQLECRLHRTGVTHKLALVSKLWIPVLDPNDTRPDCVGAGTQSTGLPVQDPFAGKIRLRLNTQSLQFGTA